jgi:hypothetical protein
MKKSKGFEKTLKDFRNPTQTQDHASNPAKKVSRKGAKTQNSNPYFLCGSASLRAKNKSYQFTYPKITKTDALHFLFQQI